MRIKGSVSLAPSLLTVSIFIHLELFSIINIKHIRHFACMISSFTLCTFCKRFKHLIQLSRKNYSFLRVLFLFFFGVLSKLEMADILSTETVVQP